MQRCKNGLCPQFNGLRNNACDLYSGNGPAEYCRHGFPNGTTGTPLKSISKFVNDTGISEPFGAERCRMLKGIS